MRIIRVCSVPFFMATQWSRQILYLADSGCHVACVCSSFEGLESLQGHRNIICKKISIERKPNILKDIYSLFRLFLFYKSFNPDIVHSATPKAGLLSCISARLAGSPHIIHTYTGQVWETKRGLARYIFAMIDRVISILCTVSLTDSQSQRLFLIDAAAIDDHKINVLGDGSFSGVDLQRFSIENFSRDNIRADLGFSKESIVFVFIGRIGREKGIYELLEAFQAAKISSSLELFLLLVGPVETPDLLDLISPAKDVKYVGPTNMPEKFLAASDVFCLPSYREGFGTVVIEAGAMGLPTIGSKINGLRDSIVDFETGILIEPYSVSSIVSAMLLLAQDQTLRKRLGDQARLRVRSRFDSRRMDSLMFEFYQRQVGASSVDV